MTKINVKEVYIGDNGQEARLKLYENDKNLSDGFDKYAIDKIATNWTDALTSQVGVSFDDGGGADNKRPSFLQPTGQYNILPFAYADGEPTYLIHNRSGNKFYLYNAVDSAYIGIASTRDITTLVDNFDEIDNRVTNAEATIFDIDNNVSIAQDDINNLENGLNIVKQDLANITARIPQISVRKFKADDILTSVNLELIKPLRQYNPCIVLGRVVDRRRNFNELNGSEYINYATKKIAYSRPGQDYSRFDEDETFLSNNRDFACTIPLSVWNQGDFPLRRKSDNKHMKLEDFIKPFVIKDMSDGTTFPNFYYRMSGSKKSHDSVLPNIVTDAGNGFWAKARFCFNIRIDNPLYEGHPDGSIFQGQKRYLYGNPFPVTMGIKFKAGSTNPNIEPPMLFVLKIGW